MYQSDQGLRSAAPVVLCAARSWRAKDALVELYPRRTELAENAGQRRHRGGPAFGLAL